MGQRSAWFLAGLFLTTVATLVLELLNTRLLSVLTWYHLSFFAVSTAMFGMSAGAVRVYLGGAAFEGEAAPGALARYGTLFALSIPLSHIVNLCLPIQVELSGTGVAGLVLATLTIAVPFYLSGIVVAVALTRIPGPSGAIYAVDLIGAALGSLLIAPLLEYFDISSAALVCGAIAAVAALCFCVFSGAGRRLQVGALAALLVVAAGLNGLSPSGLRVIYSKGRMLPRSDVVSEHWSIHGRVVVRESERVRPWYWGPGRGVSKFEVDQVPMDIDGAAATVITKWDGRAESIAWVQYDVTSLPYHLRKGGKVAVIGVGGGRDLLTALWANSSSVTGIEINRGLIHNLTVPFREYAKLADRPEVTLVHDEARSYLTRTQDRYDVLQMSLIDTWAATGAGAFTLSENGLYTVEAWREFLGVLEPGGIFSVSRWYSPDKASETSRLLALATASLLDRGIASPADHLALVARKNAATLLVSNEPLRRSDLEQIKRAQRVFGFEVLLAPGKRSADPLLDGIASSGSPAQLSSVIGGQPYDYSPPTDQRPYFFNILRPTQLLAGRSGEQGTGVVAEGNILATRTLALLWVISLLLVVVVVIGPLWRAGLPSLDIGSFGHAVAYFAVIGLSFMFVQISLMQRFSVYLGHPTYAVAVILFSMILAAGVGSLLSDRIPVESDRRWLVAIPLCIAAVIFAGTLCLQPIIDSTIERGLLVRCVVTVALVGTMALPLGFCFPIGLRLVRRLADDAMPWMWGVNGACGVLASVSAVWISMWVGIHANLFVAAILYALLAIPASVLWAGGARSGSVG